MYNNSQSQYPGNFTPVSCSLVSLGVAGALVNGSVAAADEIRKAREGKEDRAQAVTNVAKEAVGGGLAVAAGAAVARALFRPSLVGAVAMVAVSVGVKYAYNNLMAKAAAAPVKAPAKAEPAKSAKK